jgi:hypothetical protein
MKFNFSCFLMSNNDEINNDINSSNDIMKYYCLLIKIKTCSVRNAMFKKGMTYFEIYSKFCVFQTETQSLKNGVNFFFFIFGGGVKNRCLKK